MKTCSYNKEMYIVSGEIVSFKGYKVLPISILQRKKYVLQFEDPTGNMAFTACFPLSPFFFFVFLLSVQLHHWWTLVTVSLNNNDVFYQRQLFWVHLFFKSSEVIFVLRMHTSRSPSRPHSDQKRICNQFLTSFSPLLPHMTMFDYQQVDHSLKYMSSDPIMKYEVNFAVDW